MTIEVLTRLNISAILGIVLCGAQVNTGTIRAATKVQAGVPSFGVIRGIVTIDEIPPEALVEVTSDLETCGDQVQDRAEVVGASGGVANVVIVVNGAAWLGNSPLAVVNNKDCYFEPRVQVAKTRSLVSVRSEDEVLHTTHAYDDRGRTMFNIAIPVPGMVIERPLRRPGIWRLECDSHSWMRGWIYVTDDIATVTGSDGSFEFSGVQPGTYEISIWHERYRSSMQSTTVTVTASHVSELELKVKRP